MAEEHDELQKRICRACNQTYNYPVLKSLATRFYCESCMRLDPEVRATLEAFNRRIKSLTAEVEKLKKVIQTEAASGERHISVSPSSRVQTPSDR